MDLIALGVCFMARPADAGTQIHAGWGLGADLVSLEPCLCDPLGVAGVLKKGFENDVLKYLNQIFSHNSTVTHWIQQGTNMASNYQWVEYSKKLDQPRNNTPKHFPRKNPPRLRKQQQQEPRTSER